MASIGEETFVQVPKTERNINYEILKKFQIRKKKMANIVGSKLLYSFDNDEITDDCVAVLINYLSFHVKNSDVFKYWLKFKVRVLLMRIIKENKNLALIILAIMQSKNDKIFELRNFLINYPFAEIDENLGGGGWNCNKELYEKLC